MNIPLKTRVPLYLGLKNAGRRASRIRRVPLKHAGARVVQEGTPHRDGRIPMMAVDIFLDHAGIEYDRYLSGEIRKC